MVIQLPCRLYKRGQAVVKPKRPSTYFVSHGELFQQLLKIQVIQRIEDGLLMNTSVFKAAFTHVMPRSWSVFCVCLLTEHACR